MAFDIAQADPGIAASTPALLDPALALRRIPLGPELERPASFYERFDDSAVFYDVFRDHSGRHVYLIGPMALNLEPQLDGLVITGHPSGKTVKPRIHHGVQAEILRVTLPKGDTELSFPFGEQHFRLPIQPYQSRHFHRDRVIFTIN